MIFLHLGLLALGIIAGMAGCDLLHHRGIGTWPMTLVVMALVVATGLTTSAELAAFSLGTGIGVVALFLIGSVRQVRRVRRGDVKRQERGSREDREVEEDRQRPDGD